MPIRVGQGSQWESPTDIRIAVADTWQRVSTIRGAAGSLWRNVWDYDVTGPAAVTNASATWNNSAGNKCVLTYTSSSDADFSSAAVYVNRNGSSSGPWSLVGSFSDLPSTVRTVNDTTVTLTNDTTHAPGSLNQSSQIHYYLIVPYDTLGNAGVPTIIGSTGNNSTVVRGMLSSPYYVNGTDSHTWRGTVWTTTANALDSTGLYERVIQGYTSSGEHYGFFFYDNKRTGINPTSTQCFLTRTDNGFNTGTPTFQMSQAPSSLVGSGSNPIGYSRSTSTAGSAMNNSVTPPYATSVWHTVPNSWWTSIMDGTIWKSILMYNGETSVVPGNTASANYLVFHSVNEGLGVTGGCLRVNHLG